MDPKYVVIKRKSVDAIRGRVFKRDGWRCRYCGSAALPLHADHVYPVIAGGETTEDNMVTSCQRCNSTKSGKVGVWPKPIGYFDPPIPARPSNTSMLLAVGGVLLILVGCVAYAFNRDVAYLSFSVLGMLSVYLGLI